MSTAPSTRLLGTLRQTFAIFQIYAKEAIAYPVVVMIWFLTDSLTTVVLPFVWVAAAGPSGVVAGLSRSEMVTYYLLATSVSQFTTSHMMWTIAWDIQEGMISAYLARPLDYMLAKVAQNVAWGVVKLVCFVPFFCLCYLLYRSVAPFSVLHFTPVMAAAVLGGMVLSFLANFCIAMITFWVVESRNILESFYLPEMLLSGRVVPLTALPLWAISAGSWLPFKYTNAFAIEICMGRVSDAEAVRGFGVMGAWVLVFGVAGRIALYWGRRVYTGVGN